jgi:hypothetical protein
MAGTHYHTQETENDQKIPFLVLMHENVIKIVGIFNFILFSPYS